MMVVSIQLSTQETNKQKHYASQPTQEALRISFSWWYDIRLLWEYFQCLLLYCHGIFVSLQNFVGKPMKYVENVRGPKHQRGHGKHSFDQVSWPTSSKAQGLLGHVTSHHRLTTILLFSPKVAKKQNISTFEVAWFQELTVNVSY